MLVAERCCQIPRPARVLHIAKARSSGLEASDGFSLCTSCVYAEEKPGLRREQKGNLSAATCRWGQD